VECGEKEREREIESGEWRAEEERERARKVEGRGRKKKKIARITSSNFLLLLSKPHLFFLLLLHEPTMAAGAPAIKAAVQFAKAGTAAQKASVVKEIVLGMGLGLVCGAAFKVCLFPIVFGF
jgi:hypothetical protein